MLCSTAKSSRSRAKLKRGKSAIFIKIILKCNLKASDWQHEPRQTRRQALQAEQGQTRNRHMRLELVHNEITKNKILRGCKSH